MAAGRLRDPGLEHRELHRSLQGGLVQVVAPALPRLAVDVVAHRIVVEPEAKYSGRTGRQIVEELLEEVPVPV